MSALRDGGDQDYYWTPEWQRGEKESREEITAGRGVTFKSAEDAIRWLTSDDSNTPPRYLITGSVEVP